MELAVDQVTPELERELERHKPWMHAFKLGDNAYVGAYKYHHLGDSVFLPSSPPELLDQARAAYSDTVAGRPFAQIDVALDRLGLSLADSTFLDIACATGLYSFHLAERGAGHVRGVEIRPEQVEQARLLQRLDARFAAAPLQFDHVPMSADDPAYLDGESYDVVLSLGLLYHLANPIQHLRNVRRLARRGAIVLTLTNMYGKPGLWSHVAEDPDGITKATSGLSWMPYYRDLPALLIEAGFSRVEHARHPLLGKSLQPPMTPGRTRRAAALLTPPALSGAASKLNARRTRKQYDRVYLAGLIPSYYTMVAWV